MNKVLFACVCTLLSCLPASASVLGDTFHMEIDYPNVGTVVSSTTATVSPTAFWHPDNTIGDLGFGGLRLGDGFLTITNLSTGWSAATFNGFRFTDISHSPGFTSFTLVSATGNVPPLAPALSFDANDLIINFTPTGVANVGTGNGSVYNFAFSTVPEPSAGMLLVVASFLGLRFSRLRR